jgi:hypothetical protein
VTKLGLSAYINRLIRVVATFLLAASATLVGSAAAATTPQHRVLADALHAMQARGVSVRIVNHGRTLVFEGARSNEAQWKAHVAAGVLAARGFSILSLRVGGLTEGFPYHCCAYHSRIPSAGYRLRLARRDRVVAAIRQAARSGARIDRIQLLRPLGYAPVVTVTARDPQRFVNRGGLARVLGPAAQRTEGVFVIVRGPRGGVFATGGIAFRSGYAFGNVGWAMAL